MVSPSADLLNFVEPVASKMRSRHYHPIMRDRDPSVLVYYLLELGVCLITRCEHRSIPGSNVLTVHSKAVSEALAVVEELEHVIRDMEKELIHWRISKLGREMLQQSKYPNLSNCCWIYAKFLMLNAPQSILLIEGLTQTWRQ
jgi:hypothetical protein